MLVRRGEVEPVLDSRRDLVDQPEEILLAYRFGLLGHQHPAGPGVLELRRDPAGVARFREPSQYHGTHSGAGGGLLDDFTARISSLELAGAGEDAVELAERDRLELRRLREV